MNKHNLADLARKRAALYASPYLAADLEVQVFIERLRYAACSGRTADISPPEGLALLLLAHQGSEVPGCPLLHAFPEQSLTAEVHFAGLPTEW